MDSLDLNLVSSAFKVNPYPVFSLLREKFPLYQLTPNNHPTWIISRFEDAEAILKDQRFVKSMHKVYTQEEMAQKFPRFLMRQEERAGQAFLEQHMLNADPPDHTRLRSLVNLSFTPRLIEQWRERIQAITNELLDAVQDPSKGEQRREMELIGEFAFPLPMIVITEMLGVPDIDRKRFRIWSNQVVDASGNSQAFATLHESLADFQAYLSELIKHKREQNADDLLGKLIRTEAEGDKLTEDELISMVFLLLVAGHETTTNLIGNGVLALLQHPDQLEKLKQNPELIKSAVEEFLRYQGPLQVPTVRWASEDIEFGGQQIHRGDQVIILLSSANRDERAFEHADQLDITRKENHHLAFGKGIHYCLGAPLARLEGQIAISTLLKRMPNLRLAVDVQDLVWRPGVSLMALSKLPVTF